MTRKGYVYILTNKTHMVLYTGVTSNLSQRMEQHMEQHKTGFYKKSFTHRYNVTELVYYEVFDLVVDAIAREKQIKAGSRQKKIDLINSFNPEWRDLSTEFQS